MHIRIILNVFEKYKCSVIAFFLQSSRYVSNEQSCLKTSGLHDDLLLLSSLFHFFYFIFSAPISFHLFSNLSLYGCSFSNLYQAQQKSFFIHIYVYTYMYICVYIYMCTYVCICILAKKQGRIRGLSMKIKKGLGQNHLAF